MAALSVKIFERQNFWHESSKITGYSVMFLFKKSEFPNMKPYKNSSFWISVCHCKIAVTVEITFFVQFWITESILYFGKQKSSFCPSLPSPTIQPIMQIFIFFAETQWFSRLSWKHFFHKQNKKSYLCRRFFRRLGHFAFNRKILKKPATWLKCGTEIQSETLNAIVPNKIKIFFRLFLGRGKFALHIVIKMVSHLARTPIFWKPI